MLRTQNTMKAKKPKGFIQIVKSQTKKVKSDREKKQKRKVRLKQTIPLHDRRDVKQPHQPKTDSTVCDFFLPRFQFNYIHITLVNRLLHREPISTQCRVTPLLRHIGLASCPSPRDRSCGRDTPALVPGSGLWGSRAGFW